MPSEVKLRIPAYEEWPTSSQTERGRIRWEVDLNDEFEPGDDLALLWLDEPPRLALVKYVRLEAPRHGRLVRRLVEAGDLAYPGQPYAVVELRRPTVEEWQSERNAREAAELSLSAYKTETAKPVQAFRFGWRRWRGKSVNDKGYYTPEDLGL